MFRMFRVMFRELGCWALIPVLMLLFELAAAVAWGWFDHWIIATLCAVLFAATAFSTWFLSKSTSNCTGDLWIVTPLLLSWVLFFLLNIGAAVALVLRRWLL